MKKLLTLAALATMASSSLHAQTLINWGGNYVTQNRAWNNSFTPNIGSNTLNTANARTPTGGSNEYTTNGGIPFFGGTGTTRTGATENGANVGENSFTDFMATQSSNVAAAGDYASLVYFKAANFGNTWISSNKDLNFTLTGRVASTSANITGTTTRMLLVVGSQFYVSDTTFSLVKNSTAITDASTYAANTSTISLNSTSSTLWRTYDPVTSIVGTSYGTAATLNLTALDGVGWLNFASSNASTIAIPFQVYDFDVVAVPEPSSIALLGGAIVGLALLRRRRNA